MLASRIKSAHSFVSTVIISASFSGALPDTWLTLIGRFDEKILTRFLVQLRISD